MPRLGGAQRLGLILPLVICFAAPAPDSSAGQPRPAESLPAAASTPKAGDADFPTPRPGTRHAEKVAAVKSGHYDLVLIGDSITQTLGEGGGDEWAPMKPVWEKHYAPRHAINLGYSGYRTEDILWNLENGELDFNPSPKVVMLLIGTNNTDDQHYPRVHSADQVFAGTKAIVGLIRQRHPTTKILILRIFPCGGPGDRTDFHRKYNRSAQAMEATRRAGELTEQLADGKNVFWLDIGYVFLRPDGSINTDLMPDLIHPNAAGAEAWTQAVEPTLAPLMGDQPIMPDQPDSAVVPVPKLETDCYDWWTRHRQVLAIRAKVQPAIVFLGDSITHFWGGEPETAGAPVHGPHSWEQLLGGQPALNLGFGWDRTQNVLWRLDHGELDGLHPRFVVINIGSNNTSGTANARQNTPPEIVEGVRQVVLRVRAKAPQAKIVLMAVFPREEQPDHWRRRQINEINRLLAAEFSTVPGIAWLDIGPKLLQPDGTISREVMSDFCHPTERGYQIWADALLPLISETNRSTAAIELAAPLDYQVVQRTTPNEGTLAIRGTYRGLGADTASWQVRISSPAHPDEWRQMPVQVTHGGFSATVTAPAGGWWRVEVRALVGGRAVAETAVEHVGIGEVFVVAGQSNSANHGEERQRTHTRRVAAFDGRRWQVADDPQPGASGEGGSFMPPLGDELVSRFDVPIGFIACGIGATSVREWLPGGAAFPNPPTIEQRVRKLPSGEWVSRGEVYSNFVARMKSVGPQGFRAVLWHQGESDANQTDPTRTLPGDRYREYLERIIRESRRDVGWDAPWFVAQVSYHGPGDEASPDIRAAQASLWREGIALEGPDTDAIKGQLREARGRGIHFSGPGLREHGTQWAAKISPWLEGQLSAKAADIALPTPEQAEWLDAGIGIFVHWAPNVYQGTEGDNLSTPANQINPDRFEANAIVRAAKSANAGYLIFVAKHIGGYCAWQTDTTDYSLKASPWKHGRGDMVGELARACGEAGLRFGVYLSPRSDVHHVGTGGKAGDPETQQRYNAIYRRQLTEILTRYGPMFEMWFDGGNVVPVNDLIAQLAPEIITFQGRRANSTRWVGSEDGFAPYPCWNTIDWREGETPKEGAGTPTGNLWCPAECDVSILRPNWFWSRGCDRHILSLKELIEVYYLSVGRGVNLLLNITPDDHGEIPKMQIRRLREFGDDIRARFAKPLFTTRGRGDNLLIDFDRPRTIDHLVLREDIRRGERTRRFSIEGRMPDGQWLELAQGTQVGNRQIFPIAPTLLTGVRFVVHEKVAPVSIREFSVFNVGRPAPERAYREHGAAQVVPGSPPSSR